MGGTFSQAPALPRPSSCGDPRRTGLGASDLFEGITELLFLTLGRRVDGPSPHDLYRAHQRPRAVAYLSAEFLIGPKLGKILLMLGIQAEAAEVPRLSCIHDIERIHALEEDPGLDNGGHGRMAAFFLESLATPEIPATGCGIRYGFGIFDQVIRNCWQVEIADRWLKDGRVGFGGTPRSGEANMAASCVVPPGSSLRIQPEAREHPEPGAALPGSMGSRVLKGISERLHPAVKTVKEASKESQNT